MLQRYFRRAERRRLTALRAPDMLRRLVASQTGWLDIQERVNDYTLFQGTLVRRHAQVLRGYEYGRICGVYARHSDSTEARQV